MELARLHHVTCVCADAVRTLDFYRDRLGFRLVKKTVNFDDPTSYHLYLGDETGAPGSLLTFFEWPDAGRGRVGRGVVDTVALAVPGLDEATALEDPDGLRLELRPGKRPGLDHVVVNGNPDVYSGLVAADAPLRFGEPLAELGLVGAGITHHVAWRAADEAEQRAWQEHLRGLGLRPTETMDRTYFRSIYFRMPDGILFEIATDGAGFAVDEPADGLGSALALPDWLEPRREELEGGLRPIF